MQVTRAGVALLSASALWLMVSSEETAAVWVPVRVDLTLDSTVAAAAPPPGVRAFVVGRRRDLLRLVQAPLVAQRAVVGDVVGRMNVDVRPTDIDLPPGVEARVREVRPRAVSVRFVRRRVDAP